MKLYPLPLLVLGASLWAVHTVRAQTPPTAATEASAIDWTRARQLYQRSQHGETLSPADQAYLDRAKQARQRGGESRGNNPPAASLPPVPKDLKPLTELAADARYRGEDGGLYGGGSNEPPAAWKALAEKESAQIVPRDREGRPAADGKIVLLAMGMSNTHQEFDAFQQRAQSDPARLPRVLIVNGAQGGQDAADWDDETGHGAMVWANAEHLLQQAGVSTAQVQVVWLKQALKGPSRLGDFPAHAEALKAHLIGNLQKAHAHFPNLRVVYLSSRTYGGHAKSALNPEPYAYESAFSVRWVIRDQMAGAEALNWEPAKGAVRAPLTLWGPYLWANGDVPRASDGLVWSLADVGGDGTHPAASGQQKVADLLLTFFKTDPIARRWFCAAP